jgi:hypothetical protein
MLKTNSKYPKFIIYMLMALALMNFASTFINFYIASATFFITIIVVVVFLVLDRKYGSDLSNYKMTFFLLDLICIIALATVLVYEYSTASMILNGFMFLLIGMLVLSLIIDWFLIKNQRFTNNENTLVNVVKLCSMICILTYFFNVSDLFFAIDSLIFEVAGFILKIYLNMDDSQKKTEEKVEEPTIEEMISSVGQNEGDMD